MDLDVSVLIFWLYLKAFVCLDLVFVLQDVKIYSGEQTVARRTRHTWECLQSFEFKYKKNLAAGNTVENTFDPLKKKKMFNTAHVLCGEI